jgi:preprotein translocase subunit SecE
MAVKPKVETHTSPLDVVKFVVAVGLIVCGVGEFYYFGSHPLVYGGAAHTVPMGVRLVIMLAAIALAIVLARFSGLGASAWQYLMSSRGELQRVIWPSRQQTVQTTIAVIVMVVLLGVFMWIVDLIVQWGLGQVTGT